MHIDDLGAEEAPLPFAWGVLYAHPNPDGSTKFCSNCVFWTAERGGRCIIHPKNVPVAASAICGYHIPGYPQPTWVDLPGIMPVDPKFSGLEDVGDVGGTICGNCRYFEPREGERGLCHAVAKKNRLPPERVETMGCCARWERI